MNPSIDSGSLIRPLEKRKTKKEKGKREEERISVVSLKLYRQ